MRHFVTTTATPIVVQRGLHPRDCSCRGCAFGRAEAALEVRDFLEQTQRDARRQAMEDRMTWIRPILDGWPGESVLDR